MIPKTIHYCWFGGSHKPEIIEKCIASWRKFCPDYEVIEWNESNYDVTAMKYTRRAYADKKWAFVSDVARLEILYRYGGIYLDTDVEILKENALDFCMPFSHVFAFENARSIASGLIMTGEKDSPIFQKLLEPYLDTASNEGYRTNTSMNESVLLKEYPTLKKNNQDQVIGHTLFISSERYAQLMKHYGTRSWLGDFPAYKLKKVPGFVLKLRNPAIFEALESRKIGRRIEPLYTFMVYDLFDLGIGVFIKRLGIKFKRKYQKR